MAGRYANLLFNFQSVLTEYTDMVRMLTINQIDNQLSDMKVDLEPYRERENAAKVKVLQNFNNVLTELQNLEQS